MRKITDHEGDEWCFRFTGGTAIRLRDELGIDIDELINGSDGEVEAMLSSSYRLHALMAIVLEKQIESRSMVVNRSRTKTKLENGVEKEYTEEYRALSDDFYDRFHGETLDEALIQFLLAVSDSLPKIRRRALQALIQKLSPMIETAATKAATEVEKKISQNG